MEACDVAKHGRHFERHLGFYQELEIRYKPRELIIFLCLTCVNNTNKYFASLILIHNLYFYW